MGEVIIILIVALLFLGPEKLPEAAKTISEGIRGFRKQTRELQRTIEDDTEIGDAIRDIKSALHGEDPRPVRRPAQLSSAALAAGALGTAQKSDAASTGEAASVAGTAPGSPGGDSGATDAAPAAAVSTNGEAAASAAIAGAASSASAASPPASATASTTGSSTAPVMPRIQTPTGTIATGAWDRAFAAHMTGRSAQPAEAGSAQPAEAGSAQPAEGTSGQSEPGSPSSDPAKKTAG